MASCSAGLWCHTGHLKWQHVKDTLFYCHCFPCLFLHRDGSAGRPLFWSLRWQPSQCYDAQPHGTSKPNDATAPTGRSHVPERRYERLVAGRHGAQQVGHQELNLISVLEKLRSDFPKIRDGGNLDLKPHFFLSPVHILSSSLGSRGIQASTGAS